MATETLLPSAEEASSNMGGGGTTWANADEGVDSLDGLTYDAAANAHWFRLSFPTPSGYLNSGAGLQTFRLRCQYTAAMGGAASIQMFVYENGTLRYTGTDNSRNSGLGPITYTQTWDASVLTNSTGTGVEVYVAGSKATMVYDAVDWIADYSVGKRYRYYSIS
jgi:hypothetical protein